MLALLVLPIVAVTIPAARSQTFSALYSFGTNVGDPLTPQYPGIIVQGRDGNLYGTTPFGGTNGEGAIFKITSTGTLSVLHSFDGTDGNGTIGGLTLGTDGNFYGTASGGGTSGNGTLFKLTPSGSLTVLYNFTADPGYPQPTAPPIQGTDGNFYGTTVQGGASGCGTVYKLTPAGTFTTLYQFDLTHGCGPYAPLVQGTNGNLYGTTYFGGSNRDEAVFKVTTAGKLTVLYNFDDTHGSEVFSALVQGSDGNFYGTTVYGGKSNDGVVFKITPTGKLTVLHNLSGTDGANPNGGLVQATDGNMYGTTNIGGSLNYGTIFTISPAGTGFKVVYTFDDKTGANPQVPLLQNTNGILYGDTYAGGTINGSQSNSGVFYSLNIGAVPFASLVSASGKVGKTAEILGQGFTGTKRVSFNGKAATFKVSSATYLTATIPNGATTGSVTVTTLGGTLTSSKQFRVTPQILSFTPPSGTVGTPVQIAGVSLTQTTKVAFGGVIATSFTVNSDAQVTATVPTGAKTGHIVITTAGGTAVSTGVFTVTQ
jgi:uncharacterized repeat protein (TIGR03803 family)